MDWPKFVRQEFYAYCETATNCPPALIASLKNSPRATTFIANLSEEISKAERLVHKRRGHPLKLETIKLTIHDLTKLLLRGIEKEATNTITSDAEKTRQRAQLDYVKDLEATSEGNPSGDFEGLEIEFSETKESEQTRSSERGRSD